MENNKTLIEANEMLEEGESDMSVCWLFCKCKPNYMDAVTSFERAADLFHQCNNYQEEIKCRLKAVVCNRALGECYKEGSNQEKVANIYLINFSKFDEALQSIENAHVAYRSKGEIKSSLNCLLKISKIFRDMNQMEYALKCMDIAFNSCTQMMQSSVKEEDAIFTIYNVFEFYMVLLFNLKNYQKALTSAFDFVKSLKSDKYQSKTMKCYGIIVICNLISEDFNSNNAVFEENDKDESGIINDFLTLHNSFINADKENFNDALRNISINYDNIIVKRLNDCFIQFNEKQQKNKEKYIIKDSESFTDQLK